MAKYEMSKADGEGNALSTGSISSGNVEISDTIKLVSKPGVSSWRYIRPNTIYKNCYNYNRANESHLIKNSEWGAVAFLTHSQYGRNSNKVTANTSNTTTGYVGELGSTTGNIYGVYDMSGGCWETVATWDTLTTQSDLATVGNVTIDGYSYGVKNGISSKYATAYQNGTSTYSGDTIKTVCKTGDAIKETYISTYLWFDDYGRMAYKSETFFERGGTYSQTYASMIGIFASYHSEGAANNSADRSFRVVLAP